jgi:hypothetical protein
MELPRGVQSQAFPLNINRGENIILSYCRVSEHSKYSLSPKLFGMVDVTMKQRGRIDFPAQEFCCPKKIDVTYGLGYQSKLQR